MKNKSDIIYIIVNILCLALLIIDIELKNYFSVLDMRYDVYSYAFIMTNLAGPFIVCLLILFRQSHHQRASISTRIIIDSCSAIIFLMFNFFIFRMPSIPPESLIFLFLLIVPAIYNIYEKFQTKDNAK